MATVILLALVLFAASLAWLLLQNHTFGPQRMQAPDNVIVIEDWSAALERRAEARRASG